jgi:Xaa-Pro aminopeptidase
VENPEELKIPDWEFKERISRLKKIMDEKDIDMLFISSNYLDPANVRYFSDFSPQNESSALIVFREDESILCCGQANQIWAKFKSKIPNIKILPEVGEVGEVEYEVGEQLNFARLFKEIKSHHKINTLGLGANYILPYIIYNEIKNAFPNAKMLNADKILFDMRTIKSDNEIGMIKRASEIIDLAFQEASNTLKVGMTELEIQGIIEHAILAHGAESYGIAWSPMIPSGPVHTNLCMCRNTLRKVKGGELIDFQAASCYEGYNAALCTPKVLGEAPKDIEDAINAANHALNSILEIMAPGVTGEEINRIGRSNLGKYAKYSPYGLVHSIGLLECEVPFFDPQSKTKLEKNMALCIDVFLMGMSFGGFRFEDTVVVTDSGINRLTKHNERNFPL